MTMAALEDLANEEDLGEEDPEGDEEDEEEDDAPAGGDSDPGTEAGGGEGEPDGDKPSGVSGLEQLRQLLEDPEIQSTLQDQIADYQARLAAEAASREEAEAFEQMIKDEDWEGVGKAVVARQQAEASKGQAREAVVQEMFRPVYQDLLKQPELQTLTAEDREKLNIGNFPNEAAHVAAISSYIAEKRFNATVEAEVAKRVEAALTAEKNKATASTAKTPSVAGRTPAAIGVSQPKLSSADLIRSGLRSIIGETDSSGDDE